MAEQRQQPHLAINLIQLLPEFSGGIETYAKELVPRLIDRLPDWKVTAWVNSEGLAAYPQWDERCEWADAGLSWNDRAKRLTWESSALPRRIRRTKPTLLHSMTNTACRNPGCPQLSTIFDATQVLQPAPSLASRAFRSLLRASADRSDLVMTISESAARDIAAAFKIGPDRIRVSLLAARRPYEPDSRAAIEKRFGLDPDAQFFLTPASRRPNKNIASLIRAFAQVDHPSKPLLLLAGADGGADDEFARLIAELGLGDRVRMLGWITDQELDSLYNHALGLIFPSLMEGFGLPILEAMQSGCPVATSNASSMPEVGGDAAIYFDPLDQAEIAVAMTRLADDPSLRAALKTAGLERSKSFDWAMTADATVAAYRELAPQAFR